jgi:hypothetical protein
LRERDHYEFADEGEKTILKWNLDRMERYGLVHLTQYRDQWRTLANMVMNLRVP